MREEDCPTDFGDMVKDDEEFTFFLAQILNWSLLSARRNAEIIRERYFPNLERMNLQEIRNRLAFVSALCAHRAILICWILSKGTLFSWQVHTSMVLMGYLLFQLITDIWYYRFYDNFKMGGRVPPLYVYKFCYKNPKLQAHKKRSKQHKMAG